MACKLAWTKLSARTDLVRPALMALISGHQCRPPLSRKLGLRQFEGLASIPSRGHRNIWKRNYWHSRALETLL
jgi:hypothetical protein